MGTGQGAGMGAAARPSLQLTGEFQREFSSLSQERNPEVYASELLALGGRLEDSNRLAEAAEVYTLVTAQNFAPLQRRAQQRMDAILGRGAIGPRCEFLLKSFTKDATDYRMILPMLAASTVSGLVRAGTLGRLLGGGSEAWLARGLGARITASGFAWAAEVPTFTLASRALRHGGDDLEKNLGSDLMATGVMLGCLKLFGVAGEGAFQRLHKVNAFGAPSRFLGLVPYSHTFLTQSSMLAGLVYSQRLETRLGLRPKADGTTEFTDALSSLFSLGVGARLGGFLLGNRFAGFQNELNFRSRLLELPRVLAKPRPLSRPLFYSPAMLMTGIGGIGGFGGGSIPESRAFSKYRRITSLSLLGDLVHHLERRAAVSEHATRVLELGAAQQEVVRELKRWFGAALHIETQHQDPSAEGSSSDRHYAGNFLEAPLEGSYNLVLSIDGPHSSHGGKLPEMLQKVLNHLAPEGEFVASLNPSSLRGSGASALRAFENYPKVRQAIEQGLVLRLERLSDRYLLYARRLGAAGPLDLQEILSRPAVEPDAKQKPQRVQDLQRSLTASALKVPGDILYLDDRSIHSLVENLVDFGWSDAADRLPELAQFLIDHFVLEFSQSHHRLPKIQELQKWLDGTEPSPLWQKPLLFDELIRWEAREVRNKGLGKGAAVALGTGLALLTLLRPESAEAATAGVAHWVGKSHLDAWFAVGLGALGMFGFFPPNWSWWDLLKELFLPNRKARADQPGKPKSLPPPPVESSNSDAAAIVDAKTTPPSDSDSNVITFPTVGLPQPVYFLLAEDEAPPISTKVEILEADEAPGERLAFDIPPHGWVRQQRRWVLQFLNNPQFLKEDKTLVSDNLVRNLRTTRFRPTEINEVTSLLWELCFHPQLDSETREWVFDNYLNFIRNPARFPNNAPQVYREAMRLRRIFSEEKAPLDKRIWAATSYDRLLPRFHFGSLVGRGEAKMGIQALADFLAEEKIPKGTRDYYYVNSPRINLEDQISRRLNSEEED